MPAIAELRRAEDKPKRHLLDFARDAEAHAIGEKGRALKEASGEIDRIRTKLVEVDRTLTLSATRRVTHYRDAAARALGEAVPSATAGMTPVVDRAELETAAVGLRQRLREAEDERDRCRAAFRSELVEVVKRVVNEELGPAYLTAADALAEMYELLGSGFELLAEAKERGVVATTPAWQRFLIPGHDKFHCPALAARSREEAMGVPFVHDGAGMYLRGLPRAALGRVATAVRDLTGGAWPFDKGNKP